MILKSLTQVRKWHGKRVILRTNFDVKLDSEGKVKPHEDFRIQAGLKTIKYLVSKGAIVIIITKLGRPNGKVVPSLSTAPLAKRLSVLLHKRVPLLPAEPVSVLQKKLKDLRPGQVVMFENIRFYPEEEANDLKFARQIAALADCYVNDAFAEAHRKSATLVAITKYIPTYAGFLMEEEVMSLSKILKQPQKPLTVIIGGAKIETKIGVIETFAKKVDYLLIGGGLANNFLLAQGRTIGLSLCNKEYIGLAKKLLKKYGQKIVLPIDVTVDNKRTRVKEAIQKDIEDIKKYDMIVDIGTKTVLKWSEIIKKSNTFFFNGALGIIEDKEGSHASRALTELLAARAKRRAYGLVGGGETVWLIQEMGLFDDFDYVSTGGGAMLEFLEGKLLPGIKPLLKKKAHAK